MIDVETGQRFGKTPWTLLDGLRDDSPEHRQRCAERLISGYWGPVYTWLRRSGKGEEEAAELTQAFFCEVVVSRRLFERADQEKGRLRTLILSALKRYLIDQHRRAVSREGPVPPISLDSARREDRRLSLNGDGDADDAFDRRWALAVFDEAMRRCKEYFESTGRPDHWRAFEARLIRPEVASVGRPPLSELAEELGMQNAATVAAVLQTVKKRFLAILAEVAAETDARQPDGYPSEFEHVLSILK